MDNKIPNVEFDKDKVELGPNTNLSVDQFDSKQRQIDLSIKKQKHLFLVIKKFCLGYRRDIFLGYSDLVSMLAESLNETLWSAHYSLRTFT